MNPLNEFINSLSTKLPAYTPSNSFTKKTEPLNMTLAPQGPVKPKSTSVSSNPSATSTVKPVIQASTSSVTNPKSQFVDSLSTQDAYDKVTGARTSYGASLGLPDMIGGKPVSTSKENITGTTITPVPKEDPYQKYLQSLFDPKQAEIARGNITALNERTSAEILRNREREDELRKNKIGQLERGQTYQLGEEQRLSNRSLADLAIAKGASVDTLNQIMSAGKEAYGMTQPIEVGGVLYQKGADGNYTPLTGIDSDAEQFTLGKDQIRYDAQGNIIASGISSSGVGGASYIAGADPTVDSWVKWVQSGGDVGKVPEEYRNQVVQGISSTAKPQSEISKQVVTTIGELLASPALSKIFGPIDQFVGGLVGPEAVLVKNKYNQLKGLLSLDNIKYLKGTGAISDAEQRLLANAASALGRNLYGEQARQELIKLRDGLSNIQGESSGGTTGDGGLFDW